MRWYKWLNPNFCILNKLLLKLSTMNSITISILQIRKQIQRVRKTCPVSHRQHIIKQGLNKPKTMLLMPCHSEQKIISLQLEHKRLRQSYVENRRKDFDLPLTSIMILGESASLSLSLLNYDIRLIISALFQGCWKISALNLSLVLTSLFVILPSTSKNNLFPQPGEKHTYVSKNLITPKFL